MWNYFFMFIALVAGTFIGMGGTFFFLAMGAKEKVPERKKREKEKVEENEPPENEVIDEQDTSEAPLTRKIPPKDFSVADFNCMADGVDAVSHVASQQQNQDNAYNTLKRRKKQ